MFEAGVTIFACVCVDPGEKERHGSARTDYTSNQMLVEKARKRQKMLREKAGVDGTCLDILTILEQLDRDV